MKLTKNKKSFTNQTKSSKIYMLHFLLRINKRAKNYVFLEYKCIRSEKYE